MLKSTSLSALQLGTQVEVSPGDTLEVEVSFDYRLTEPTQVELWLSLVIPPGRDYTIKYQVYLPGTGGALETWTGTIEIPITSNVGLKNLTYDLWAEIRGTNLVVKIDAAIVVSGITTGGIGGILDIIPMMVIMMMMSVMMPMMEDTE